MHAELGELARQKELSEGQERNRLHRTTRNWAWCSDVTHRLNGKDLYQEESRYNLRLRCGLMPQDIPATCNGCGKKFSSEHSLSCPKGALVLAGHTDAGKEWGTLGFQALFPSDITYEPKINSRTVQGKRTEAGERHKSGTTDGGADTVGESQGGSGPTVNGAA